MGFPWRQVVTGIGFVIGALTGNPGVGIGIGAQVSGNALSLGDAMGRNARSPAVATPERFRR